jgi:hypothetical protein
MSSNAHITIRQLKEALEGDYQKLLQEAEKAVNEAPDGAVIAGSEEAFRDAVARFRRVAYEKAIQLRAAAAAQAAFPPSGSCGGGAGPQ